MTVESIPLGTSSNGNSPADSNKSQADRSKVYATSSDQSAIEIDQNQSSTAAQPEDEGPIRLKPKMTLLNGCTVIIGSIIGSGIFVAPRGVLLNTGSVNMSLIIWVLSGVYSLVGAFCFAELGCMIPRSGADYAYIMESFGPFFGFVRLWIECVIVRPASQAVVAITFAIYALKPFYPDCEPPTISVKFLAIVCILILTYVNCRSVAWSTMVQDVFTYGKLLALVVIIGGGLYQLTQGKVENFTFDNTKWDVFLFANSFYSGLFAYNGWNYLNFVIEELIEPAKNLPKAIGISVTLVTVVYFLTIVAFHTTLSVGQVLESQAVAVLFAQNLFGGAIAALVPVFVAMSTFGGVNGILLTSSRLFYAGAQEKQMPTLLSMIQVKHLTPAPAVVAMCLLSLVYLLAPNIDILIGYVGFASWLAIGIAVACVPYLRRKHPDWERPIKIPIFLPYLYIVATIFITFFPMVSDPFSTMMGTLMILTSVPVYFLFIGWKSKPKWLSGCLDGITLFVQKLMIVVPPERKDD